MGGKPAIANALKRVVKHETKEGSFAKYFNSSAEIKQSPGALLFLSIEIAVATSDSSNTGESGLLRGAVSCGM